jgi:hypothetical protein
MPKFWWFEAIQELTDLTNAIVSAKVTPQTVIYRLERLLEDARRTWPHQVEGTVPPGASPGDLWVTGDPEPAFKGALPDDF